MYLAVSHDQCPSVFAQFSAFLSLDRKRLAWGISPLSCIAQGAKGTVFDKVAFLLNNTVRPVIGDIQYTCIQLISSLGFYVRLFQIAGMSSVAPGTHIYSRRLPALGLKLRFSYFLL